MGSSANSHSDADAEGPVSLGFGAGRGHHQHVFPLLVAVHDAHALALGGDCILLLPEALEIVKDRPGLLTALAWRAVGVAVTTRQMVLACLAARLHTESLNVDVIAVKVCKSLPWGRVFPNFILLGRSEQGLAHSFEHTNGLIGLDLDLLFVIIIHANLDDNILVVMHV